MSVGLRVCLPSTSKCLLTRGSNGNLGAAAHAALLTCPASVRVSETAAREKFSLWKNNCLLRR